MLSQVRKFLAVQWLLFLILGVFWASAMFLPLFLWGAIKDKSLFWQNMVIMWGPYALYVVVGLILLFMRSVRWAYLVANFLFSSERERVLAREWFRFSCLGIVWPVLVAGLACIIWPWDQIDIMPWGVVCLVGPYGSYCFYKFLRWIWMSIAWSVDVIKEK